MRLPLTTLALTAISLPALQAAEKPNIIFILADDLGIGDINSFSDLCKIQTPNIDAMVEEGVRFMDAHTSSAVSTPTRYGALTGRYNWRSTLKRGVLSGYSEALIAPDRSTIATKLKEAGYKTAAIGKWHLGWDWSGSKERGYQNIEFTKAIENGPTTRGFDYFFGFCGSLDMPPYVWVENDMPTMSPTKTTVNTDKYGYWRSGVTSEDFDHTEALSEITQRGAEYIVNSAKDSEPYFLYLPMPSPHTPILPSDQFAGKSGLNPYGDYVMRVDYCVGLIREAVEKSGEANNTIVLFTADNGCSPRANIPLLQSMGHYPSDIYKGRKTSLYEGGHRVPTVITYPAKFPVHTIQQTISLVDFYHTFAAAAGVSLRDNEAEDSYNLLPLLTNAKEGKALREATVFHSNIGDYAIRQGDWKLLLFQEAKDKTGVKTEDMKESENLGSVELYNMKDDPAESKNLADKNPEIVKQMQALLISYIEKGRSTDGIPQKNDGVPIGLYFGANPNI